MKQMKKQVLLGSVLLAAVSTFSQNGLKQRSTGLINTKLVAEAKYVDSGIPSAAAAQIAPPKANAKTSAFATWQHFTGSMNIYGVVISYSKPLQWNDELDAVTFVHRKSPTYPTTGSTTNTESGSIVAMVTTDCGENWDSTLVYADPTNRGRYPQGAIYNPTGNTDISNAYIVTNGPVTLGTGWVGDFYASKQLGTANYNSTISAVPNAIQYFANTPPYPANLSKHDFAAYSFTSTDDGKVRALGTVAGDINNTTTPQDSAIMLITGTFNNGVFDWVGKVIDPPTIKGSDGERQWVSRPFMAWNELGDVGYIVAIGARLGATGSNVGFQPIVYKTTNSGGTWSLENGINFNSPEFADVKRSITSVNTDSLLEVPFFNWIEGIDCAVDANNKLHLFSSIIGTASNHPDSVGFIRSFGTEGYRWPHTPGFRPYLYDFVYDGTNTTPSWSHIVVDSMSTEGIAATTTGNGYQDNPWDADPSNSNQKVRIDARLQMSRTPDGQSLLYSWAESDTNFTDNQKKWNNLPNVKVRLFDVVNDTLSSTELDLTESATGDVANHAMYHFISSKMKPVSITDGLIDIDLPVTVSNSSPYAQLTANKHWYACNSLSFERPNTVGIIKNKANSIDNSSIFPNPAKGNATVKISLVRTSDVQVQVLNTMGQVVKTTQAQGQVGTNNINVDLNGLSSGIYLVNIKSDNASTTKKLVIE
jgi:hypothetical protein